MRFDPPSIYAPFEAPLIKRIRIPSFAGNVTHYFPVGNPSKAPACRYKWQSGRTGQATEGGPMTDEMDKDEMLMNGTLNENIVQSGSALAEIETIREAYTEK